MTQDQRPQTFEQALEQHMIFRRRTADLRGYLDEPRPEPGTAEAAAWASALCHHVVGLHDSVSRHFLVEELGLLRELLAKHPAALPRLEESRSEHLEILEGLRALVADAMCYAEAKPLPDEKLRARTHDLLERIGAHEEKVNDLVQDLTLTDTGTGD